MKSVWWRSTFLGVRRENCPRHHTQWRPRLSRKNTFMITSSDGNIFLVTGLFSAGNSPVTLTKARDEENVVFFDLRLNKRLSKQSKRRWFETPSHPLWRHCNAGFYKIYRKTSNVRRILVGNKIVDHADVVGASPTNYIFIHDLTSGFKGFGKDSHKTVR